MLHNRKSSWLFLALVAGTVILVDQTSKMQAVGVTLNPGVGLGMAASIVSQQVLAILTIGMLVVLWFVARSWWLQSNIAAGLFFGGALSNMADRLQFGGVRDWLAVPVIGIQNNLADWAIFLGLAWILRTTLVHAAQKEMI